MYVRLRPSRSAKASWESERRHRHLPLWHPRVGTASVARRTIHERRSHGTKSGRTSDVSSGIRRAVEADEAGLVSIDAKTETDAVTPAPRPTSDRGFWRNGVSPENVVVLEADGIAVGYVVVGQELAIPSHAHVRQIRGLAVDPAFQRQGFGRELVEAAVELAREQGARKLTLRVLSTNEAARRLYAACGFHVEGHLRGEFLLGDAFVDDILMARFLDETFT